MPARRKISARQMELLVEFAESHRDIALGRFPGGPQAFQTTRQQWDSIASQLNSIADGMTKTSDQWRRYWIEFKAKTKAKAADIRRNATTTGGGPNRLAPLSSIEERVLAIMGPVAVDGLPGVRLPIDIPLVDEREATPADLDPLGSESTLRPIPGTIRSVQSTAPPSSELQMEEEWLEVEIESLQAESQANSPPRSPERQSPLALDVGAVIDQPDNRQTQRSTTPPARQRRQSRRPRQIHRDQTVPRWAYDLEVRRIAAEERNAAALEALVDLMTQIRNDIHSYVNRTE